MTLDEAQADAFRRLARGVADRRAPCRNVVLATSGADGHPSARTVVLRGFDASTRLLQLHSDVRTAKIEEIRAEPRTMVHAWDPHAQIQLRLAGRASLRLGAAARPDWDRLHPGSRATYAAALRPGTPLADPAAADRARLNPSEALLNFAVLDMAIDTLDWLHLARTGHRRARFTWAGSTETACWIVP